MNALIDHGLPLAAITAGAVLWAATAIADYRAQRRLAIARETHEASLRRWLNNRTKGTP